MNKTMKKTLIIATLAVACAGTCLARPHGGHGGHRGGFGGPRPMMYHGGGHHHSHHHGGSFWGHGGRNFWPGFVGGMVGGVVGGVVAPRPSVVVAPTPVITPAPVVVNPAPVVVSTPVYTTQNVWVEGRYVDQVQPNGAILRVWQPGHYEQRQVQAY